ncbi:UPF0669 protein C6orf120 homolog [Sitophilus oryzae]|nr:UPF0669 protein C6orf120 homolog [Sitophilus oryzae]
MFNLLFILVCVIFAILLGKLINVDITRKPRILARTWGHIDQGNFTYIYLTFQGPVILNLSSLSGDADLYISDNNMYPTFDADTYTLHSATCGQDIIEVPEIVQVPLAVGIYGYSEMSEFILEVHENLNSSYPYKQWAIIQEEGDVQSIKPEKNTEGTNKRDTISQVPKKKKRRKTDSDFSTIFSILEVLELIFL